MRFQSVAYAALAATVVSAQNATANLTSALGSARNVTSLVTLLNLYPSLLSTLNSASNITLLAPSDQALSALLSASNSTGATPPGLVEALLSYHVLNGTYLAANVTNSSQFIHTGLTNTTYANVTGGQVVEAVRSGGNVTFFSGLKNNVSVSQADIAFSGGVIHVINGVLSVPQNLTAAATAANLTAFAGAARALNLTSTLNGLRDVTVFAPNNAAFQSIGSALANASTADLTSILQYHVVNTTVGYSSTLANTTLTTLQGTNLTISVINGTVYVNSARVITPDVLVAGGVVHVIDGVLNPLNATATADPVATTGRPAFSGATSASDVPFTSGIVAPTSSAPAAGPATTSRAAGGSSTSSGGAMPMKTGAVGAAALFGGAAMLANW